MTYDEVEEQVEKNVFSYDLSEMDWAEYLTHFTYIVAGIGKYRDEINRKLSDIDKKICDVLHYIELCETDDQEAVDLVELLRVCRENRREIKDELTRVEYFQINLGTSANAGKARQALKSIQGLDTRKYKPRKFDELFKIGLIQFTVLPPLCCTYSFVYFLRYSLGETEAYFRKTREKCPGEEKPR